MIHINSLESREQKSYGVSERTDHFETRNQYYMSVEYSLIVYGITPAPQRKQGERH